MIKWIKNITFYIAIATILTLVGKWLESPFIFDYLKNNILGLLLTLLAINTATSGLIASKIQDIMLQYPQMNFANPIEQMKLSLLEQIILIIVSVVTLLIINSPKIEIVFLEEIGNVLMVSILIYAVNILWDTGKSVFIIIEEINKINHKE